MNMKKIKGKVFLIIKGQCTLAMKHRVENSPPYQTLENQDDVAGLLKLIKSLAFVKRRNRV